ncbi:hypothetical protein LCGC14_1650030 [marine sediment metagenome]|uniref:Uncharacterized protein n=1 Tax=marine sediment metagenome TaxID=412755 RepID=A0A0F9IJK9_9ZZZZ
MARKPWFEVSCSFWPLAITTDYISKSVRKNHIFARCKKKYLLIYSTNAK